MKKVDFHSHILPGVDHGSEGIHTSMDQLRNAIKAGVTDIVCTPHYYHNQDTVEDFVARREEGFRLLNEEIQREDLPITLHKACELNLQVDLLKLESLDCFKIAETRYILIELPWGYTPEWYLRDLEEIQDKYRLVPIIAHIDRISREKHADIFNAGYMVQVNASAFVDTISNRRYYKKHFQHKHIHLLGSDAHMSGSAQYESYVKALEKIKDSDIFQKNAIDILSSR